MGKDKNGNTQKVELKGRLLEFRKALEDEIEAVKNKGLTYIFLLNGHFIDCHNDEYWYLFSIDSTITILPDTPCKLIIENCQYDVTVFNVTEDDIRIRSAVVLPEKLGKARLEIGNTILLERLIKRIEENAGKENAAGYHILPHDLNKPYFGKKIFSYNDIQFDNEKNEGQKKAIQTALEYDVTFIWGPPGTGKSTVIGSIVNELYNHNRTVLLVSQTNTAVDGAIKKADEIFSKENPSPILRYETSEDKSIERTFLQTHIDEIGKDLKKQKADLEEDQAETQKKVDEIRIQLAKDEWIKKTKLYEIQDVCKILSDLNLKKQEKLYSVNKTKAELEEVQAKYPEYVKYRTLENERKKLQKEYDEICSKLIKFDTQMNAIMEKRHSVSDEIKKHELFEALRKEAASYMSIQFYENEIQRTEKEISLIEESLAILNSSIKEMEKEIEKYEAKNRIGKFFYGKKEIEDVHLRHNKTTTELKQTEEELVKKQELVKDYQQQRKRVILIQEKMKALQPSKSKEYWRSIANNLQNEYIQIKNQHDTLAPKQYEFFDQIKDLEKRMNVYQKQFYAVNDLVGEYQKKQNELTHIENEINHNQESFNRLLDEENALCTAFSYHIQNVEINKSCDLFEELKDLYKIVQGELETLNISEKAKEKEELEVKLQSIFSAIKEINQKIADLEKQVIMGAKIIGTTLTKLYLNDKLRERKFDTVIVDEASMASIPALWCAAYLAEKSIVIVGDFLQLSPIVVSNTEMSTKWLSKDIFYYSGMQALAKKGQSTPDCFVMLNEQYRMESDIASIVNDLYYDKEYRGIISHDELRICGKTKFYDWYDKHKKIKKDIPVHLFDTSSMNAWATGVPQGKGNSRLKEIPHSIQTGKNVVE